MQWTAGLGYCGLVIVAACLHDPLPSKRPAVLHRPLRLLHDRLRGWALRPAPAVAVNVMVQFLCRFTTFIGTAFKGACGGPRAPCALCHAARAANGRSLVGWEVVLALAALRCARRPDTITR